MKTMIELKPCPFCGGKAYPVYTKGNEDWWTSNVDYLNEKGFVCCLKCFARTEEHGKIRNAIEAWNTRIGESDTKCD